MQVAIGLAMLDPDEAFVQKMNIVRLTDEESAWTVLCKMLAASNEFHYIE